jgi:hypothetical protein
VEGIHTSQISALFLPEPGTGFLDPLRQGDLDILRHGLLAACDTRLFANHRLNPLDSLLAIVEAPSNILRQTLDCAFVLSAYIFVSEPRQ